MIAALLALAAFAADPAPAPAVGSAPDASISASEPATAVTASVVVQVTQPAEAADTLVDEARELGGWFQSRTETAIALRVPTAAAEQMLEQAATLGRVVQRDVARHDLHRELAELRGRLAAREEVLDRYYAVLDEAGPQSVVAVERQIVSAIEQIEALQGRIRLLEDQATWARVDVAFQFRDRSAPVATGSSSFPWLDSLDIAGVAWGLQIHRPYWRTRGVQVVAPDGFSAWRRTSRYRATSPDGVLFRVRTVKHEPEADLAFWKEAARERMRAAGYTLLAEEDLTVSGRGAALLEVGAPFGEEDWTCLVVFLLDGRRIVVVEAAGEATKVAARRDAIVAAIEALRP